MTPSEEKLSGFVFKIHANMDPGHRDRIAFLRICSGKDQKGMRFYHVRSGNVARQVSIGTAHTPCLRSNRPNVDGPRVAEAFLRGEKEMPKPKRTKRIERSTDVSTAPGAELEGESAEINETGGCPDPRNCIPTKVLLDSRSPERTAA